MSDFNNGGHENQCDMSVDIAGVKLRNPVIARREHSAKRGSITAFLTYRFLAEYAQRG